MIPETSLIAMKYKLVIASGVALAAFIADVTANPEPPWESYTLKGILVLAVIYLGRELAAERANNKLDHQLREERMIKSMEQMTDGHKELVTATKEQTKWFESIAKELIQRGLGERE
jgi:hypothetical protein